MGDGISGINFYSLNTDFQDFCWYDKTMEFSALWKEFVIRKASKWVRIKMKNKN